MGCRPSCAGSGAEFGVNSQSAKYAVRMGMCLWFYLKRGALQVGLGFSVDSRGLLAEFDRRPWFWATLPAGCTQARQVPGAGGRGVSTPAA